MSPRRQIATYTLRFAATVSVFAEFGCCCTPGLWRLAPRHEATRLLDARVNRADHAEFDVELRNGDLRTVDQWDWDHPLLRTCVADARYISLPPWDNLRREPYEIVSFPASLDPATVAAGTPLSPDAAAIVELHDALNRPRYVWITPSPDGPIRWGHPGSWLCAAATPVTFVVDVATLPVQAIVVNFFFTDSLRPIVEWWFD